MPKVISNDTGEEQEVETGELIREACRKLGVQFGCCNGECMTCVVRIIEGEENLEELNDKEKGLGMDKRKRLACQCRIKDGDVTVSF